VGGIKVDGCGGCGGVWFDHRELTAIAQTQAARLTDLEAHFRAGAPAPSQQHRRNARLVGLALREFAFPHAPGIALHGCGAARHLGG